MSASTSESKSPARAVAPIVVIASTWAARKGLAKGFEATTGRPAPRAAEKGPSMLSKVLWAAAMAGVVVLVESLIWKAIDLLDGDVEDIPAG